MDSGRYSPSGPAFQELSDEGTTDLQADVQDAIDNLEHIDQIETGLDEAAVAVIGLETGASLSTDHQMGGQASSEQEDQVFHDATAHEAELEQEIAQLPSADVSTETTAESMGMIGQQYTSQVGDGSTEDADADAEGEIDMDLGDEDDEMEEPRQGQDIDSNIDPSLMEMQATANEPTSTPAVPTLQVEPNPTPIPIPVAAPSTSNVPVEQRRRDDRSASPVRPAPTRRRPGQQRRSPSYSLDAVPTAVTGPTNAAPGNSILPPGPRAGLPVKPTSGPTPPGQPTASSSGFVPGRRNEPRHYAPRFNFEGVEFPEGIQVTSPSVASHQALASSWAESECLVWLGRIVGEGIANPCYRLIDPPGGQMQARTAWRLMRRRRWHSLKRPNRTAMSRVRGRGIKRSRKITPPR